MEERCGTRTAGSGAMRRILKTPRAGFFTAAAGLILMGIGIYRGEMSVVMAKAINICLECIGIG